MTADISAALSQITAYAAQSHARDVRINADTRVIYLRAVCAQTAPTIPGYGHAGFDAIIASRFGSRYQRRKRATTLLQARIATLFNGCSVADMLAYAARTRRAEINLRHIEASDANLAATDRALASVGSV